MGGYFSAVSVSSLISILDLNVVPQSIKRRSCYPSVIKCSILGFPTQVSEGVCLLGRGSEGKNSGKTTRSSESR